MIINIYKQANTSLKKNQILFNDSRTHLVSKDQVELIECNKYENIIFKKMHIQIGKRICFIYVIF